MCVAALLLSLVGEVFEAAGFDQGQEVVAQPGFAVLAGEVEAVDREGAGLGQGVGDALTNTRHVAHHQPRLPVFEVGQQPVIEAGPVETGLEVARSLVHQQVHHLVAEPVNLRIPDRA